MRRAVTFHPVLFALFPILSLYAANLAIMPIEDTYRSIGIVLGCALLLWLLLFAIVRDWKRSGMAVSVAVTMFFAFGYMWSVVVNNSLLWWVFSPKERFQTIWIAFSACLGLLFLWKWKFAPTLNSAFNWIGVVLVALPLYTIGSAWLVHWRDSGGLEVSASSVKGSAAPLGKPDIFYIILDGYGREDSLKQFLGFDNSSFVDGLKQRGFYVADNSHSNYCQTDLSLASSLNMDFLQNAVSKEAQEANDRGVIATMIDRSAVAKYLKQRGYEYEAITSGAPNISIKSADIHVQDEAKVTLFESTLLENTPLGSPKKKMSKYLYDNRRSHLLSALTLLERAGNPTAKPRFLFVHILAPHPPFVVGANGEPITPTHPFSFEDGTFFYGMGGTPAEYQEGYLAQLQYLNKRVTACVDEIIRQEHTRPIIIIQGDHGSKKGWEPESLAKTNLREVYRNLNAYYVSPQIEKQLYPSITPVNSFRVILDTLFSDDMPKLADKSYFSKISKPLEFQGLDAAKL